jgi:SagB-type dehydrogenase family enzyme
MLVARGDKRRDLSTAAFDQHSILDAPAVIVFSAVYERTTLKYGDRGKRYVHMETGHAAQNVCLQAVTLKLGTVTIGAFRDEEVKKILSLMNDQEPLYLMPVGRRVNG